MADSVVEEVVEVVQTVVENITEAVTNGTGKTPSSPEGIALAYGSLVVMALIPIFFGSFRSIIHQEQQKAAGEKLDTVTTKDAAMFPLIASCALLGLYIIFTVFSKDYINLLLSSYFFFLGVFAMSHVFSPFITGLVPTAVPLHTYTLVMTKVQPAVTPALQQQQQSSNTSSSSSTEPEYIFNYKFTTHDCVCLVFCAAIGVWYLWQKHWIANNLLGLAFAFNGIELLNLNSVQTGALLLGGLFFYDIFWVFGTNVMVTVARSFEAPIKLVFPQDLLEKGFSASNFAMLGLGDIVIPGIFIALLLRFDKSLNRGSHSYFHATFFAYLLGLLSTIFVMHIFKHAQPALLYLVPFCLGAPALLALIKGDFAAFIKYEDVPEDETTEGGEQKTAAAGGTEVTKRVTRGDTRKDK
uniref:Minor histocompatibility antigen H13-like n=2 Tax=Hirondellea gigas TaxID=1518452 RepID=A0A2P2I150_9CRUS